MKRIAEWDFFKGILIILIILGHTTACFGTYDSKFILEYLSSLTVSFIMPMFLIITGYFIYSFKPEAKNLKYIIKKAKRLLIPALIWGGIGGFFVTIPKIISSHSMGADIVLILIRNIKYLWYLYATFVSAFIIWYVEKFPLISKKKNIILISIIIILHLIPTDLWNITFSYTFILTGYYLRKRQFSLRWFDEYKNFCFVILGLYLGMLFWFPYDYSIYVAGTNLITNNSFGTQLYIVIFRFIIGISGAVSMSWLAHMFFSRQGKAITNLIKQAIQTIGEHSLEMYCTQFIVIEILFARLTNWMEHSKGLSFANNSYLCYFVWRHVFGFLLVYITYILVITLKKTKLGKYIY